MARILVIEDEDAVRQVVVRILTRQGHEVASAEDGEAGIAKVRSQPFDLIFTDLIMPNKEGLETIREIRKISPGTPIIAMSGYWGRPYLEAAGKLGADALLCKPFSPDDAKEVIQRVLARSRREPERPESCP